MKTAKVIKGAAIGGGLVLAAWAVIFALAVHREGL